jgi:hypothetical protein
VSEKKDVRWPVRCACGRSWSRDQWTSLSLVGKLLTEDDSLELRQCVCLSTLAVDVDRERPTPDRD